LASGQRLAREIRGEIEKATGEKAAVALEDGIVRLSGRFGSLQKGVDAGHVAAGFEPVREVVNDIDFPGKPAFVVPDKVSDELTGSEFDVVIAGGGVIGLAVARELSRFNLKIALVERHDDLGMDQTLHSSAMVHPAVTAQFGTLKWEMNHRGNPMWDQVASELDVDFQRVGTLFVAENPDEEALLSVLVAAAAKHKDPAPRELDRSGLDEVEPGLAAHVRKGILLRNTGIISVFDLLIAYAENAAANGVRFFMDTAVVGVRTEDGGIRAVDTTRGTVRTRILINAAGLYADRIAELAGDRFFTIHPRKGETIIFDPSFRPVRTVLAAFSALTGRSQYSKGGGIIPTTDGHLQFGPTAEDVCDKEDVSTTAAGLDQLVERFGPVLERLKPDYERPDRSKIITQFAGCRAATYKEDFIIEPSRKVKGLVHAAGIQSPGLASAPAIAERVRDIVRDEWRPEEKGEFEPCRTRRRRFSELGGKGRKESVRTGPAYGHIVCRCEKATEGEIIEAVRGGVPATSIDAVKRRTRAGMGRCQGGFCMPRVLDIISREADIEKQLITKNGGRSFILVGRTKQVTG